MQVGDLVELSSAGNKNQQNLSVFGKIGLLIEINKHQQYGYVVEWYGCDQLDYRGRKGVLPCKRYELKKFRVKK